ncbi:uncharacterized protein FTJAE_4056 [Fusarium tjaetaba]|uniref:AA1-like domain-containing protein n=1 Tax=Fusarium tjaetaba TaxID=1567544 RepID=A0A8H5RYT1_9HYPO|nr:uncharacterized protein FTJAE_4056 [Fusarium tjaetaba]KAF5641579.1 hypothetical protein FTJAE_4056 [Fusarium tjaetaba]
MQFFTLLCLATSALALPQTLTKRETCMDKGSKVTEWTVKDFKYEAVYTQNTPTKQTNSATITFTLQNRGVGYEGKCSAKSTDAKKDFFTGNTDYNCDVPFEGDSASFKYNRKSGVIAIFQHWSCVKEGGWYEAKGNTTFTPKCTEKTWKNAHYKADGDKAYSNRRVTCQQKQLKVPVLEMQAVL